MPVPVKTTLPHLASSRVAAHVQFDILVSSNPAGVMHSIEEVHKTVPCLPRSSCKTSRAQQSSRSYFRVDAETI